MTTRDHAWLVLAVLTVRVFEHRQRIVFCAACDAWSRAGTHSHASIT